MKNKLLTLLPVVTALFVGLALGLFLGRNPAGGAVTVSVPARLQTEPAPTGPAPTARQTEPVSFPVNINTADAQTLSALPGIGEVLAGRIVDYRDRHGSFRAVEEITRVEGIGQGRAEAILDLITVGG